MTSSTVKATPEIQFCYEMFSLYVLDIQISFANTTLSTQIIKCKERTTLQTINKKIRTGSPYVKQFGDLILALLSVQSE